MRRALAALLLSVSLLTGCQSADAPSAGASLSDYEISTESGTYRGLLGIPEGENRPVVFILHGAHFLDAESPAPYYKGFEYLVQELAGKGYLAISLDINHAYSGESPEGDEYARVKRAFQASYEQLVLANGGEKSFPYDLTDKADLSRINLIGHSRGGENILALARDDDFRAVSFVSAIKIAASENDDLRHAYADLPTALIYSQYDEDVVDSSSANYYYYAYGRDLARSSPLVSAFLYGASHAAYNPLVDQAPLFHFGDDVAFLDPEAQRDFVKKFVLDFLNVHNQGAALLTVFQGDTAARYGIDFMLSVHDSQGTRLLRPDAYLLGAETRDVDFESVVSSSNAAKNTAGAFRPVGAPEALPLCKISWERAGGVLRLPIDGMYYGITETDALAFYLALDSSDAKNGGEAPTTFDVVLTDQAGNRVRVPFSSDTTSALRYQPEMPPNSEGNPERQPALMPLGTELIRLDQWGDTLTIDHIVSLEIVPTSATGAVMLGGIDVYHTSAN